MTNTEFKNRQAKELKAKYDYQIGQVLKDFDEAADRFYIAAVERIIVNNRLVAFAEVVEENGNNHLVEATEVDLCVKWFLNSKNIQ